MQTFSGWGESLAFPALSLNCCHGVQLGLSDLLASLQGIETCAPDQSISPLMRYPALCPPDDGFCRMVAVSVSP